MPSTASEALLLADADPITFRFAAERTSVLVQIAYYTSADCDVGDEVAAGTGLATLTATGIDGVQLDGVEIGSLETDLDDGVLTDCLGRTWYLLEWGCPLGQITISADVTSDPATALAYRLIVAARCV
jgi:hypothetical protein